MTSDLQSKEWDKKLSYSSFNTFMACNRKYYHKKIANTPIDSDADDDTVALRFGKAFHKLLEDSKHVVADITIRLIKDACDLYLLDFDTDGPHLYALLANFKSLQEKTNLKAIHCEVYVETPVFKGYVDVILQDETSGEWWIGDMKTASAYSQLLNSRLPSDWQLNLYAAHAPEIASATGLKLESFAGCRYLLNVKSKAKRKASESLEEFAARLTEAVACYDIAIYKEELQTEEALASFRLAREQILLLHEMKNPDIRLLAPTNFNSCTAYFKPCEFWSECHGKNFTKMQARTVVSSK